MSVSRLTEILEDTGSDYMLAISKGRIANAVPFLKIGYNPAITTTEEDIWSAGAVYAFPTAAAQWRIAGGNAAELGTVIKGNAEGADQTIKCDPTGDAITLKDANVDFSAATAVAVGDIVLLDPKGASPEFGYVTDITNAATGTLIIGNGFSEGGSCATARAYTIVDKSSATGTGGQVVEVYYLTNTFVEKKILVCLNGATAVDFKGPTGAALTDTYRLNGIRLIAVGTGGVPVAAIAVQLQAVPNTVYGNIALGYTVARAAIYTVPKDKALYVHSLNMGASSNNAANVQTARVLLRASCEDYNGFITNGIMNPFAESLISNSQEVLDFSTPIKFPAGVDIKVSAVGLTGFSGPVSCIIRGWLENV